MIQVHDPRTREAETGGLGVQGQPGLLGETLPQKQNHPNCHGYGVVVESCVQGSDP